MGRRTPGEGSIYPVIRGGKRVGYMAQVSMGSPPHRRYVRLQRKTKSAVRDALKELNESRSLGAKRSRQMLGDYLAEWLDGLPLSVKPNTVKGYRGAVNFHIVPALGHIRLSDLTPIDVERALSGFEASQSYRRKILSVLHKALADAVRKGLIVRNVASASYVNAPHVPDRPPQSYSPKEVQQILRAAPGSEIEVAVRLALATGIRQGELLGLAWEDVTDDWLHIRHLLDRGRREELKNGSRSRRSLPLSPEIRVLLQQHRRNIEAQGFDVVPSGPVFVQQDGSALTDAMLYKRWVKLVKKAGVPHLPWKNLRTTFASRMFEAGVPDRKIADWLGHRRTSMTHGHYIDTSHGAQDLALRVSSSLAGLSHPLSHLSPNGADRTGPEQDDLSTNDAPVPLARGA